VRAHTQATSLAARLAELESEVDAARSEALSFGSMAASKERDAHWRLEGLQDELEHANEQVGAGV
jgi:outer membrane murein-binding lipoprotein Lpp